MRKFNPQGIAWLPVAAVIAVAPALATAATVFTDRDAWQASTPGATLVETFDVPTAGNSDASITFPASGIVVTKSNPNSPTLNRIKGGDYDGFASMGFQTITWTLPQSATGFAADFAADTTNTLNFASLFVTAQFSDSASETFSITDALGNAPGFFGLSGSQSITSLLFTTDTGPIGGQSFSVDNVALASATPPVAPVPLPATLPLMLGLLGLGSVFGRRRRRAPTV